MPSAGDFWASTLAALAMASMAQPPAAHDVSPRVVFDEPTGHLVGGQALELHAADERVHPLDEEPSVLGNRLPHDPDVPVVELIHEIPDAGVEPVVVRTLV